MWLPPSCSQYSMPCLGVHTMHGPDYPWPLRRLLLVAGMKGAEAGYSYQHYTSHADTRETEGGGGKGGCGCGETVMAR